MNFNIQRIVPWLFLLACIQFSTCLARQPGESEVLTFGVVPQQAASKLARLWTPILRELGERSGHRLEFKTAPDIPSFEKRLSEGFYDFAYMNPYHYTVFGEKPGYRAIGKQKNKQIRGILVVRKDSPINNIHELDGQTLAFPAPAAFAASVLPRNHLAAERIHISPKYVSSHDSVYYAVEKGLYPAGGGIMRTLKNLHPGLKNKLRILWTTPPFTPHAIAVHPRVPNHVTARIQAEMYRMHEDDKGKRLLGNVRFLGINPADHDDWNDVRALNIKLMNYSVEAEM